MSTNNLLTYPVIIHGLKPKICFPTQIFTGDAVGSRIVFDFSEEWNAVPYRTATFWAGDRRETVPIVDNVAVIPSAILKRPWVNLYVSVCGKDSEPDMENIARGREINERLQQITDAINAGASGDELTALLDECGTLRKDYKALGLPSKIYPSMWGKIGSIFVGATPSGNP